MSNVTLLKSFDALSKLNKKIYANQILLRKKLAEFFFHALTPRQGMLNAQYQDGQLSTSEFSVTRG